MQEVMQYMKIMFASLGCDKNLVDTENMLGILNDKGFEFTDDETQADVIVVNTCCFIGDAKQESINTILEMAQHKEDAVCKALIVTGCLAHRYKDEIIKEIPEVDAFLGTTSYDKIAEVVTSVLEGKGFNVVDDANRLPIVKEKRIITTPGYFEYLKKNLIFVRYFPADKTKSYVRISVGTPEEINTLIDCTRKYLQ